MFASLLLCFVIVSAQKFSVILHSNENYKIVKGTLRSAIAVGSYENKVNQTGWGVLNIQTNPEFSNIKQAYAAGFLESYLTHDLIYMYWNNYKANEYKHGINRDIRWFMGKQFQWWRKNMKKNNDDFWKNQKLIFNQFKGMCVGYNQFHSPNQLLSIEELYFLNSVGDLPTLGDKFEHNHSEGSTLDMQQKHPDALYHECSAFIKYNPINHDIIFSHNTWRPYYAMLRIFKHYKFSWTSNARPMTFSSSPGMIHSKDDYYILKNQFKHFAVIETTNSFYNKKLNELITPQSLLSWQRVLGALYFGKTCKNVVDLIGKYNSGTYNNQWMVIDLTRPNKNSKILFIGEQMPGKYITKDVTNVLFSQTYWASYNIPYIHEINSKSGYPKKSFLNTEEYDYKESTRARIFSRDGPRMRTINDVKKLMTMNHYKTDPISDRPRDQIASRFDLENEFYNDPFGAIDCKVGAASMGMKTWAYGGPTHEDNLPPFTFKSYPKIVHSGTPEKFDFDWVQMEPSFK